MEDRNKVGKDANGEGKTDNIGVQDTGGSTSLLKYQELPGTEACEKDDDNLFRSNIFEEQPRQILVLVVTIVGASYLGFSQNDTDPDGNTRAALLGVSFLFLVHCFLQCRDTVFVHPHPGVWRVVHGIGWLYLFGVSVLLFHPRGEAMRVLSIVFPDVQEYTAPQIVPGMDKELECTISPAAVIGQLGEVWFPAHVFGWWGKMCVFRDWSLCWVLSIGFELLELSLGWLVPQFKECWWDSLVIDLLGANVIGMLLGLATLRFLETRTYDWDREPVDSKGSRALRLLARFSPLGWSKWRWEKLSSFKRMAQMMVLIVVTMMSELNAFLMLNALDVPKSSTFNYVRLLVLFSVGLLACNEFYSFCTNPSCKRLGQNAWIILAIMQVEILTWVKFLPQPLLDASSPPEVRLPWLATLSLFSLWGLLFYTMSKDVANRRPSIHEPRTPAAGAEGRWKEGDEGAGTKAEVFAERTTQIDSLDAVTDSTKGVERRHSWQGSLNTRHRIADVVKWGMVDAVFVLCFVPLLYLLKQWSY